MEQTADQLTFSDILSSNLLDTVTSFSLTDMVIAMGLSFIVGLFIFFVYKQTYSGVMYSSGFGISLIAMALITTMIIIAIGSNIILSLSEWSVRFPSYGSGLRSKTRWTSPTCSGQSLRELYWAQD